MIGNIADFCVYILLVCLFQMDMLAFDLFPYYYYYYYSSSTTINYFVLHMPPMIEIALNMDHPSTGCLVFVPQRCDDRHCCQNSLFYFLICSTILLYGTAAKVCDVYCNIFSSVLIRRNIFSFVDFPIIAIYSISNQPDAFSLLFSSFFQLYYNRVVIVENVLV